MRNVDKLIIGESAVLSVYNPKNTVTDTEPTVIEVSSELIECLESSKVKTGFGMPDRRLHMETLDSKILLGFVFSESDFMYVSFMYENEELGRPVENVGISRNYFTCSFSFSDWMRYQSKGPDHFDPSGAE